MNMLNICLLAEPDQPAKLQGVCCEAAGFGSLNATVSQNELSIPKSLRDRGGLRDLRDISG